MSTSSSPASPAPPTPFTAPWQLRTYVIAAALVEKDLLDPAVLKAGGDDPLRAWLSTVQQTLVDGGLVSPQELDAALARQVAASAARDVH